MPKRLAVLNLDTARFECVYPACKGGCCKGSRPPVEPGEEQRIRKNLKRFLPMMRPLARALVERGDFKTARMKGGRPSLAVVESYCVFWNDGCVLHKAGAAEGDKNRYKPGTCITFPLDQENDGEWYVRQWGQFDEGWDLPCLDPKASKKKAGPSLTEEIAFAERMENGQERWRD